TRLTPTSLELCICLKDHLDATEHIQHIASLEDELEYEGQLHDVEVTMGEANIIFDEELTLDEATSEARSSEADEEDVNLEQALV
nr:zinc finger BED domain-containing protein RICESLEEPER 2 [Tanacetum cinerariifolium]